MAFPPSLHRRRLTDILADSGFVCKQWELLVGISMGNAVESPRSSRPPLSRAPLLGVSLTFTNTDIPESLLSHPSFVCWLVLRQTLIIHSKLIPHLFSCPPPSVEVTGSYHYVYLVLVPPYKSLVNLHLKMWKLDPGPAWSLPHSPSSMVCHGRI